MIQLHASKALFAKLPLGPEGRLPLKPATGYLEERLGPVIDAGVNNPTLENPLSGWQAHLFTLQRRQCVLWVHGATRFPLFMPCLTKPDFADLQWHFIDTLMNTLLKAGATEAHMNTAEALLQPLQIDSVCDRSVQGTLNQMRGDIEHSLYVNDASVMDLSPYRTGVWLADRPTKVKGQKDWLWPQKEMFELLDAAAPMSLVQVQTQAQTEAIPPTTPSTTTPSTTTPPTTSPQQAHTATQAVIVQTLDVANNVLSLNDFRQARNAGKEPKP